MRYFITGGCGFVGSNLAAEVLERGDELCVFDNCSRVGGAANLSWLQTNGDFAFIHGDIRNANDVDRAIAQNVPDVVFHLAAQVAMVRSIDDPVLDFETNAAGTLNLLEAIRRSAPEAAMVYASSNKVYGELEWVTYEQLATRYVAPAYERGFDESIPLDLRSPYGCSKGAADQYVLDYARAFGLRTVVFRHSSMYGGHQVPTYDQAWIGWFCQKALEGLGRARGERFTVSGNGKQVRDVLHISDVRRLYFDAVARMDEVAGRAFNIGGGIGNSLSLLELFSLLEETLGVRMAYRRLPQRHGDQKVFVSDNGRIERAIGWRPRVGVREGVGDMVQWLGGAA